MVAVQHCHIVHRGGRVEVDRGVAVDVHDVAVTLEQGTARGRYHCGVHRIAQLQHHPVHNGVVAGDHEHGGLDELVAATSM